MGLHKDLIVAYEEELGYTIPSYGKEGAGAKRLLAAGYSIDEVLECYRHFKLSPFWKDKHLSLQFIASNIAAWRIEHEEEKISDDDLMSWFKEHN